MFPEDYGVKRIWVIVKKKDKGKAQKLNTEPTAHDPADQACGERCDANAALVGRRLAPLVCCKHIRRAPLLT